MSRRRGASAIIAICLLAGLTAFAQRERGFFGGRFTPFHPDPNIAYDARFTFVRLKYKTAPGGYWWRGLPSWAHGYPLAEQNLMKIMKEVSLLDAHDDTINTLTLDDPEIFSTPSPTSSRPAGGP